MKVNTQWVLFIAFSIVLVTLVGWFGNFTGTELLMMLAVSMIFINGTFMTNEIDDRVEERKKHGSKKSS